MAIVGRNTIAMVLAGGKGERLSPLTLRRAKPGVAFGGKYKIIDFVLSNLFNSGIKKVYILTQYRAYSLNKHIRESWGKWTGLGEFYELYAIAAAVLGGCSLRGGEGTITGVIIGTAVMRVLYNAINILGIPTHLEFAIIGAVILAGVIADELVKRMAARRRATRERAAA